MESLINTNNLQFSEIEFNHFGETINLTDLEANNSDTIIVFNIEATQYGCSTGDNITSPQIHSTSHVDVEISNIEVFDGSYSVVDASPKELKKIQELLVKNYKS